MGALSRATLREVEELADGDPQWWPMLCGAIAEGGLAAALAEKEARQWSWGGLWRWIVGDEKRYGEYMQALEAYAQLKAHETISIADEVEESKAAISKASLRVRTRNEFSASVDPQRWGRKQQSEQGAVVLVDAALVGFASDMLARLKPVERVVESLPVAPDEI